MKILSKVIGIGMIISLIPVLSISANNSQNGNGNNNGAVNGSPTMMPVCAGLGGNVYDMESKGPTVCCANLVLKLCGGICTPSIIGKCEKTINNNGGNGNNNGNNIENKLENKQNIINRIQNRLGSTTASTSEKRMGQLNSRYQKQYEQMERVRERLLAKEMKVIDVLQKIADKIADRIGILTERGLTMDNAEAKLAEATDKITEMTTVANNLADLLETEVTDDNQESLFQEIKTTQNQIKNLARATHALLVDTIKEITKVLPRNDQTTMTATSTATSTDED